MHSKNLIGVGVAIGIGVFIREVRVKRFQRPTPIPLATPNKYSKKLQIGIQPIFMYYRRHHVRS